MSPLPASRVRMVGAYWWRVAKATIRAIDEDRCLDLAAQLSFYLVLAMFPALLVLVSLLGYLPVENAAAGLLALVGRVAPSALVDLLAVQASEIMADGRADLATVGMAGALWSSSAAMRAVIEALNRIYRVAEWRPWWRRRLVALGLTLAFGLFTTASLLLVLAGPEALASVAAIVGARTTVSFAWQLLRWPAMVALVVLGIGIVYHVAPNRPVRWTWTTPGALLATALWICSSFLFKLYVTHLGTFSVTYGAIGSVIVVLLWLYLSSLAILVGAEFNSAIAMQAREAGPGSGADAR